MTDAQYRTEDEEDDFSHLPLSTKVRVLGVEIKVHQRAIAESVHLGRHRGGLEPDAFPQAVGSDVRVVGANRREIAAWARRNLFGGASDDTE